MVIEHNVIAINATAFTIIDTKLCMSFTWCSVLLSSSATVVVSSSMLK
jgi:hypothetical protein